MIQDFHPLPSGASNVPFNDWVSTLSSDQSKALKPAYSVLSPLLSAAPYLMGLAQKHTDFLCANIHLPAGEIVGSVLSEIGKVEQSHWDEQTLSKSIREAKGKVALIVAIAETGGVFTPKQAAIALSDLADITLNAALGYLLDQASQQGKFVTTQSAIKPNNCGLTILALGKHGGRELNYSSDIDIVTFYDPEANILADPSRASRTYSRIVQKLAALMQDRTEHGYVFRTDLRLRPDPGSTPVAISTEAALTYYEARGQNWERAAWIKARPAAGDLNVAQYFLKQLAPFIWRKHLDFATIADIQAMKRQIDIAQNVGQERLRGHNVKLGRGGIREIEFFAQTQQLIAGGREANLRVIPTAAALTQLAHNKWIAENTATEMINAYWFLRAVENRIQMLNDEQTHKLPENQTGLNAVSRLMGYETLDQFEGAYRDNLQVVVINYTNLFVDKNALSAQGGNLVFTGAEDDPATLETLSSLGFSSPQAASAIVRKWQYGGYAATRAAVSRAHLTELLPTLLQTIARAGNADKALERFDNFLSRLPTGVQLFAMLRTKDQLCHLLVAFMASAPKMAEAVIQRAHVLDGLIDPARTQEIIDPDTLRQKIDDYLGEARSFEEVIDRARIVGQEEKFLISAGLISGSISPELAAKQFSTLAETLLDRLFEQVRDLFEHRHGKIPGAKIALLAFGKLGSMQMSVASDLDVVLLYDAPNDAEQSDGEKPLNVTLYFTRLTQRLISALSSQTSEGILYELDMRLRPSGNAGPLATSLGAFTKYQKEKAWTWEHQAITRARVAFAVEDFAKNIDNQIAKILLSKHDARQTIIDVKAMRARLAKERPARHEFDLKMAQGGLLDIEFIAQSAVLLHPKITMKNRRNTVQILLNLYENSLLPAGETLAKNYQLMSAIAQISSASLVHPSDESQWTDAFKKLLAQLTNYPNFSRLHADITQMKSEVHLAAKNWYGKYS